MPSGSVTAVSPLSRRAFLGVAGSVAAAGVVGCDESSTTPRTDAPGSGTPGSPDTDIVAAVVASHQALQSVYRALVRAHPSTRPQGEVLIDHLAEHLSALGEPTTPGGPPRRMSPRRSRAVASVRAAEASARRDRTADSLLAESGDLARVLASVAACHAQHVIVLDDLQRSGR